MYVCIYMCHIFDCLYNKLEMFYPCQTSNVPILTAKAWEGHNPYIKDINIFKIACTQKLTKCQTPDKDVSLGQLGYAWNWVYLNTN